MGNWRSPLLLLLPAAMAAPTSRQADESLQLLDATAAKHWKPASEDFATAQAPLFMLKLDRTGSSWFADHVDGMKIFSKVNQEINDEPEQNNKKKYGETYDGPGYKHYCSEATKGMLTALKGWNGKFGATTLNPYKQPDIFVDSKNNHKLKWMCMTNLKLAIQQAIKNGTFPPPRLVVLTRKDIMSQAISTAKGEDMARTKACDLPYTEKPDVCTERFYYKWKQDPEELLQIAYRLKAQSSALWVVAKDLQSAWGSQSPIALTLEDFAAQGQGKGLALPAKITDALGVAAEGPDTIVGRSKASNKAGKMSPKQSLKNYEEVLDYFQQHAPKEWVTSLIDSHSQLEMEEGLKR